MVYLTAMAGTCACIAGIPTVLDVRWWQRKKRASAKTLALFLTDYGKSGLHHAAHATHTAHTTHATHVRAASWFVFHDLSDHALGSDHQARY